MVLVLMDKKGAGLKFCLGLCAVSVFLMFKGITWLDTTNLSEYMYSVGSRNRTYWVTGMDEGVATYQEKKELHHLMSGQLKDYKRRIADLKEACRKQGTPQVPELNPDKMSGSLIVDASHTILYCNIPKVGSTFWKRLFNAIKPATGYQAPFKQWLGHSHMTKFRAVKDKLPEYGLRTFLKSAQSFMFVRDPYARLYSGYENKIYQPNLLFWRGIGRKAVAAIRRNASADSLEYGHDVTFFEYVKYILKKWKDEKGINEHFAPMHRRCNPCLMPYQFIGRLETFKDDVGYLLGLWKETYPDITIELEELERQNSINTMTGHIKRLFATWNNIKNHVQYPFYNLLLRTWNDNHIRGFLSKKQKLPFKQSEVSNITIEDVLAALQRALKQPSNRTEVKLQREEAQIQAYRTVPLKYMEEIRQYVLKDCQLFGFDDRPVKLFDRRTSSAKEHIYMDGI